MSTVQARNNYIGQGVPKRLNCAQSVISAFRDKYNLPETLISTFSQYGSGNAPGGLCGAYYAVKYILEQNNEEMISELEDYFLEQAGSLECNNIKKLKKLSCVGCVEKSSQFLDNTK